MRADLFGGLRRGWRRIARSRVQGVEFRSACAYNRQLWARHDLGGLLHPMESLETLAAPTSSHSSRLLSEKSILRLESLSLRKRDSALAYISYRSGFPTRRRRRRAAEKVSGGCGDAVAGEPWRRRLLNKASERCLAPSCHPHSALHPSARASRAGTPCLTT